MGKSELVTRMGEKHVGPFSVLHVGQNLLGQNLQDRLRGVSRLTSRRQVRYTWAVRRGRP